MADIPSVIATAFSNGTIAVSSALGFGLGMGLMAIIKKGKKKSKKEEETAENQE